MKDGVTASMASQGRLSDDLSSAAAAAALQASTQPNSLQPLDVPPSSSRSASIGCTPLERIITKQGSLDNKHNKNSSWRRISLVDSDQKLFLLADFVVILWCLVEQVE